jgi:hypothetical protein
MAGAFHLDLQAVGYKPCALGGGGWQAAMLFTLVAASRAHRATSPSGKRRLTGSKLPTRVG